MYFLIFWIEENAWSVLTDKAIADPDGRRGEETTAKFKGKFYPALIVDYANDKDRLLAKGASLQEFVNDVLMENELEQLELLERIRNEYINCPAVTSTNEKGPVQEKCNKTVCPAKSLESIPIQIKESDTRNVVITTLTPSNDKDMVQERCNKTICTPAKFFRSSKQSQDCRAENVQEMSLPEKEQSCGVNQEKALLSHTQTDEDEDDCVVMTSPNHKFVTYEEFERLAESVQNLKRRLRRVEDSSKDEKSQSASHLDELIETCENEFEAVETLSLSVFGKEALINNSVSGKRANTKCAAKKPLDFEKLSSVRRTLKRKFPNIKKKDVTEKIQSVQKKLRRNEKKNE